MLGARLKSWMEAQLGRGKKRKQKQRLAAAAASGPVPPPHLSSPESAYSTGYSTDGTSPGAPPTSLAAPLVAPPPPPAPPTTHLYHEPAKRRSSVGVKRAVPEPPVVCMTPSPRPRSRIRTNPWLGTSPTPRRRPQNLPHQQSLQCPLPAQSQLHHAPYSLDSHPAKFTSILVTADDSDANSSASPWPDTSPNPRRRPNLSHQKQSVQYLLPTPQLQHASHSLDSHAANFTSILVTAEDYDCPESGSPTNPWLKRSPSPRRRPHLPHQKRAVQSLLPPPQLLHASQSLDSHPANISSILVTPADYDCPEADSSTRPWLSDSLSPRRQPHLPHQKQSLQCLLPPPQLHASHSLDSHSANFTSILVTTDDFDYPERESSTNPRLTASPSPRRRPHLPHQKQSVQCLLPPGHLLHASHSLDSHPAMLKRSPHLSPHISPQRSPYYRGGASSDEECRKMRTRGRETAILSDADIDSDGDTGLDGGDEDEPDETASPGRRRARRRRPPRRPPRSAGATPPRARRRNHAPSAPPVRERDPLLEADREAERKYRELIREAEKLLVTVSRAPLEPPHNPRVRELRATEVEAPRRSPERTHITNFMRANSPEPPRRLSPVARRSPLAALPPPPVAPRTVFPSTDRPHSEPPKRKAYARDEVLQTLEGLRKSLQQQSALLAVQRTERTRLDSL